VTLLALYLLSTGCGGFSIDLVVLSGGFEDEIRTVRLLATELDADGAVIADTETEVPAAFFFEPNSNIFRLKNPAPQTEVVDILVTGENNSKVTVAFGTESVPRDAGRVTVTVILQAQPGSDAMVPGTDAMVPGTDAVPSDSGTDAVPPDSGTDAIASDSAVVDSGP